MVLTFILTLGASLATSRLLSSSLRCLHSAAGQVLLTAVPSAGNNYPLRILWGLPVWLAPGWVLWRHSNLTRFLPSWCLQSRWRRRRPVHSPAKLNRTGVRATLCGLQMPSCLSASWTHSSRHRIASPHSVPYPPNASHFFAHGIQIPP